MANKVTISSCPKCKGIVSVLAKNLADSKTKKDFFKEVVKYSLDVKEMNTTDYATPEFKPNWCQC